VAAVNVPFPLNAKGRVKAESHDQEPVSTKERILLIAEGLFAEKGFEGTRTRDIAERAGINISTLHFHWKCKEDLYIAVYQRLLMRRAKLADETFAFLETTPTTTSQWEEALHAVVEKLFAFFRLHKQAARLETYWILEPHPLSAELAQSQAGPLLMSMAERLRKVLPSELSRQIDVELTILTVNAILKQYFANPETFGKFLGESHPKALENRVRRYMQQMMMRLYNLL